MKNGGNFTVIPEAILGTYTIYGDVTSGNKVSVYINDEKVTPDIDISVSVNNAACFLEPVNSNLFKINEGCPPCSIHLTLQRNNRDSPRYSSLLSL